MGTPHEKFIEAARALDWITDNSPEQDERITAYLCLDQIRKWLGMEWKDFPVPVESSEGNS